MSGDAFDLFVAELAADYLRELPAKLGELENLWDRLANGRASDEQIGALKYELHTLVGTAQTMGLAAVTDTARAAETCLASFLDHGALPDRVGQEEFGRLLAELKQSIRIDH
jgi:chemotaxis protein histidine kinase CheA